MTTHQIPTGFEPIRPFGKFHELIGPLYGKLDGERVIVGLRVEDKHGNRGNNLHGGMMCALADSAMTYACAQPGDWLEAQVDVMRQGRRVIFLNTYILRGEERLARSSATFQLVPRPGMGVEPRPGESK